MPRGTFTPLENPIRFFARPHAFTLECPYCGRLLFVGKGLQDERAYNRITGVITCPHAHRRPNPGCGRRFLVGIVVWPLRSGPQPKAMAPEDQQPEEEQAAEIRAFGMGRIARMKKKRGDSINQIEPLTDPTALKETR